MDKKTTPAPPPRRTVRRTEKADPPGPAGSVSDQATSNRILAALPPATRARLLTVLEPVSLAPGQVIYRPESPIEYTYFITSGLVSLVKTMSDGRTVEIGAIGVEGVTGPDALFGIPNALLECIVRVPGTALRMRPDAMRREMALCPVLSALAAHFVQAIISQISQTAACNRLHSLEQRCCRWLLIAHDSALSEDFRLTHEFLAMLLGAQRAGVSLKVHAMQAAGLIAYRRGTMTILDREGLLDASCECYGAIRKQLDDIFKIETMI